MLHAIAYMLTAIFAIDLFGALYMGWTKKLGDEPLFFGFIGFLADGLVASLLTACDGWSMPLALLVLASAMALLAVFKGWGQDGPVNKAF